MNRPLTVSLTALPLGLLLLALMGSAASMTAQVTATLEVDKSRLLPRETFNVSLKIVNFSGQTLVFGEDNDWLHQRSRPRPAKVFTIAELPKVEGRFTVESSIRATKRIDLAPYYALDRGWQLQAHGQALRQAVEAPPAGQAGQVLRLQWLHPLAPNPSACR